MLTKTIKCIDYNGVEREQVCYFNLTKAELMEMEMGTSGGFAQMVENIIKAQDTPTLIKIFKEFILKAYGEKSADGLYFNKVDEDGRPLYRKFMQTEAYSNLFMELSTDTESAIAFINGIIPDDVEKKLNEEYPQLVENK